MSEKRVLIVGGGLAGLAAAMRACELGLEVDIFSMVHVKRSHSVCAQGGINGAVNTKGEGDSPYIHFVDTIKGGDFLADQPPVLSMCEAAPAVINMMDRLGVTFNRTPEGLLDFRRFGGTLHHRTAFAGASTGQQLLYGLDEQVRRWEAQGKVRKFENWEFTRLILDKDGKACGIVAQDLTTMEFKSFPGFAVVLATGGPGLMFGKTTNSTINFGSATAAAYKQGVWYGNPEMVQIHPTGIPGSDKLRLISESARGEGGRVWVPRKAGDTRPWNQIPAEDRYYFLEERYPLYGNLVPRDIASREIALICTKEGLGIGGRNAVYLDLTHRSEEYLLKKLGAILDIYEKFRGVDPKKVPMEIYPAYHYSMGGLYAGYEADSTGRLLKDSPLNQMTNIPGVYAVGEADHQYHGANRLGANSLMSCIFAGLVTGESVVALAKNSKTAEAPSSLLESERKLEEESYKKLLSQDGPENPFVIHKELGDAMSAFCLIERHNDELKQLQGMIDGFELRLKKASSLDKSGSGNMSAVFLRQLDGMITMSKAVVDAALLRDECRGAHSKPAFDNPAPSKETPIEDPAWTAYYEKFLAQTQTWLKTTVAKYDPNQSHPVIEYKPVDTRHLSPEPRDYTGVGKKAWKKFMDKRQATEAKA